MLPLLPLVAVPSWLGRAKHLRVGKLHDDAVRDVVGQSNAPARVTEVPKSAWDFKGKTFVARVVIQGDEDDEYGPSNEIKSFLPAEKSSAPSAPKAADLPPSMNESDDTSPGETAPPSKPSL